MHIDHDHTTGVVRGVLCKPCNTGLGLLGDSEEGLSRALDYLREGRKFLCDAHPVSELRVH